MTVESRSQTYGTGLIAVCITLLLLMDGAIAVAVKVNEHNKETIQAAERKGRDQAHAREQKIPREKVAEQDLVKEKADGEQTSRRDRYWPEDPILEQWKTKKAERETKGDKKQESKATNQKKHEEEERPKYGDQADAIAFAKDFVRRLLRAVKNLEFSSPEVTHTNEQWIVNGTFKAVNAFDATINITYIVMLQYGADRDEWHEVQTELQNEAGQIIQRSGDGKWKPGAEEKVLQEKLARIKKNIEIQSQSVNKKNEPVCRTKLEFAKDLLRDGKPDKARKYLEQILELAPYSPPGKEARKLLDEMKK